MNTGPSAFDHRISRRQLLRTVTLGSAAALLATATTSAIPAAAAQLVSVAAAQPAGGKEFHGAWPFELPPNGHFNYMVGVAHGILRGGIYDDLITLPMAMYYWKQQQWLPLLANNWSFDNSANTFTIQLQSGLSWSDGKPLTSKDVVSTFWAARIIRNVVWQYIDSVTALDDLTVSFHMSKPSTIVERYVLRQVNILSDVHYGDWARKAQDLFNSGKDLDSPEGKQLNTDFQKFNPPQVIASGPFNFDYNSITNAQLTLVKNPAGYRASNVLFDKIVLYNGETPDITPIVLNKDVDYATHGFPPATEQAFQAAGIRVIRPPVYSGPALLMNLDKLTEFSDKRARQAIAYAVDRGQNGTVSLGQSGVGVKYMAGFSDLLVPNWISADDVQRLNPYPYDPAKATELLTAAGWQKSGDTWMTPNGTAADYELIFPAEFADWSASGQNLADQLTRFGMKVTPRSVTFTQEPDQVDKGDFQMAIQAWGASTQPHPHFSFVQDLFTHNIPIAANKGGKGMAFPLKQNTDASGPVDLEQLVVNAPLGLDEAAQRVSVTQAAIAFNELLPMVPLFERYGNNPALEGTRVVSWPPDSDPTVLNAPYGDNFTIMLLLTGDLKPV
jgi:peptide/nickel transport system substrate-binding protein